jgi:CheY-like chemotaxis protein
MISRRDEPTDAQLILRGFEKAKVLNPIVHLTNGDEALPYLPGRSEFSDRIKYPIPALVVLDLKLPGLTGIQLLQWLHVQGELKRIPLAVLTTDDRSFVQHNTQSGAVSLLAVGKIGRPTYSVHCITGRSCSSVN